MLHSVALRNALPWLAGGGSPPCPLGFGAPCPDLRTPQLRVPTRQLRSELREPCPGADMDSVCSPPALDPYRALSIKLLLALPFCPAIRLTGSTQSQTLKLDALFNCTLFLAHRLNYNGQSAHSLVHLEYQTRRSNPRMKQARLLRLFSPPDLMIQHTIASTLKCGDGGGETGTEAGQSACLRFILQTSPESSSFSCFMRVLFRRRHRALALSQPPSSVQSTTPPPPLISVHFLLSSRQL